ncbi:unnamed protein product [Protopolystoma xenopodis]|uniref:Cwf15/Cwc15 cell cycle control protein n=1 Tax=Protopolystoma xenopodis TaxID=117903 RepID=A0A3S4ZNQ6_9PLAT|nr:unnamed protein product [Protopolystoma xenopodis]
MTILYSLTASNIAAISSSSDSSVQNEKKSITLAALPSNSSLDQGSASKRPRMSFLASRAPIPSAAALAAVPTANLDADDPWEEDYDEDEVATAPKKPTLEGEEDDDATDDEEEDEEALLMELAKIKRERAEEIAKQAAERRAAEETIRIDNILRGNPLLTRNDNPTEFKVKRRWDDDVVFKNCARGEIDHAKRGFINDTLRSEFHKKFMKKYIH